SLFGSTNLQSTEDLVPFAAMERGSHEQAHDVAVVVVPLPAQSHLAQLLHLSLLLCGRPGVSVHYATSRTHIRQAKSRLHPAWGSGSVSQIRFHELPIPAFPSPPPDLNSASTKFPAHFQPMFDVFEHLRTPLSTLLRSLSTSSHRVVVVHDSLSSFVAAEAAALHNVESYTFHCVPALFQLVFCLPSVADELRDGGLPLPPLDGIITEEFGVFARRQLAEASAGAGTLFNTCRPIEGLFIDLVAREPEYRDRKLFTVGPLSPMALLLNGGGLRQPHECLDWLDKQAPASVVYVSFGTTTSMSEEQVKELANGLLRSGQRFIWVLRDADRADIFTAEDNGNPRRMKLPPELEHKVEGTGMVVRGWAPQLEILAHPSMGAFMSHCGWNSCMESLCMGVPMIAWPMHSDQPTNAALVTEHLKVGVTVREWTPRGDEVVGRSDIEEAIKRVMVYEEGRATRARARVLGEAVRAAAAEGGASRAEFDAFVAHITR
ncbi:unnamed protein product, partial [Musa acuminata subsp. malaccensis]